MTEDEFGRLGSEILAGLQKSVAKSVLSAYEHWLPFDTLGFDFAEMTRASFGPLQATIDRVSRARIPAYESLWSVGWMPDMHTPTYVIDDAAGHVKGGALDKAHELIGSYYEGELDRIEASLAEMHPQRAQILSSAIAAHRREEYVLSVPTLLAQCDGMAIDILQAGLYAARGTMVAAAVESSPLSSYVKRVAATLGKSGSIHAVREDLDSTDPLNRHAVLHGRSTTYGTQVKSLQAIGLASFVGIDLAKYLQEGKAELVEWRTSSEGLSVVQSHWEKGKRSSRAIVGTVGNTSEEIYRRTVVRVELWDKRGGFLGRLSVKTHGITPGGSLRFRAAFPDKVGVYKALPVAVFGQ